MGVVGANRGPTGGSLIVCLGTPRGHGRRCPLERGPRAIRACRGTWSRSSPTLHPTALDSLGLQLYTTPIHNWLETNKTVRLSNKNTITYQLEYFDCNVPHHASQNITNKNNNKGNLKRRQCKKDHTLTKMCLIKKSSIFLGLDRENLIRIESGEKQRIWAERSHVRPY